MSRPRPPLTLARVTRQIVTCERCARLRAYCREVARVRRAAYRDDEYWGRPVPGFGDPAARVLLLGLAPAAHGANRTGRVFTGDGAGGSGDFLMAALHRAGFANLPTSVHPDDGLRLRDVYIAATVRCAPPDNKPLPSEVQACADHLDAEVAALPRLSVVVTLGKIAWDAWFQHLARHGVARRPRPAFGHGAVVDLAAAVGTEGTVLSVLRSAPVAGRRSGVRTVIGCYHPSRQNTNTGKLTPPMYDAIFALVQQHLR